jgi:hypothetical protein
MLSLIPLAILCDGQLRQRYVGRHGYSSKDIVALCGCSVGERK